ncbi:MAG: hypothetical protein R3C11_24410 [Planctomycetaceae bacterium]
MIIGNYEGKISFNTVNVSNTTDGDAVELTGNSGSLTAFQKLNITKNQEGTGLSIHDWRGSGYL